MTMLEERPTDDVCANSYSESEKNAQKVTTSNNRPCKSIIIIITLLLLLLGLHIMRFMTIHTLGHWSPDLGDVGRMQKAVHYSSRQYIVFHVILHFHSSYVIFIRLVVLTLVVTHIG